jgi:hypothetical protein
MSIRVWLAAARVNSIGEHVWHAWFIGIKTDQTSAKGDTLARRPNYSFAKHQKELKRQRKKEEKAAKRLRKKELATQDGGLEVDAAEDPAMRAGLRGSADRESAGE